VRATPTGGSHRPDQCGKPPITSAKAPGGPVLPARYSSHGCGPSRPCRGGARRGSCHRPNSSPNPGPRTGPGTSGSPGWARAVRGPRRRCPHQPDPSRRRWRKLLLLNVEEFSQRSLLPTDPGKETVDARVSCLQFPANWLGFFHMSNNFSSGRWGTRTRCGPPVRPCGWPSRIPGTGRRRAGTRRCGAVRTGRTADPGRVPGGPR
jgi:hypothetical protein